MESLIVIRLGFMTSECNTLHLNQADSLEVGRCSGILLLPLLSYSVIWPRVEYSLVPTSHVETMETDTMQSRHPKWLSLSFLWFWENHYWHKSCRDLGENSSMEGYLKYEGRPKMEYIYKNCVFIATYLNFTHLQSSLHLVQYIYQDFFPLLKTVFELINFDAF